ncbi:MAG: hypothetical protein V7636_2231 [Actinomycetota bacterium]
MTERSEGIKGMRALPPKAELIRTQPLAVSR